MLFGKIKKGKKLDGQMADNERDRLKLFLKLRIGNCSVSVNVGRSNCQYYFLILRQLWLK